jgi:hypothetical protein
MVVKLLKALYGCVESSKLWYDLLATTIEELGYIRNPYDQCVFNKVRDYIQCTVLVYVDDLFITSTDLSLIDELTDYLRVKFKEVKIVDGPDQNFLGMRWNFSTPGEVKVTMEHYVNSLLEHPAAAGKASTPAAPHLFQVRQDAEALDEAAKQDYHTTVARLLYLAKRVRPDLLLTVSFLTTRVTKPDQDDYKKLRRCLQYVNDTRDLGLVLRPGESPGVRAYVDASHATHDDMRSHTGLTEFYGGALVNAKSAKQKINTKSSAESELVGASDMAGLPLHTHRFIKAQGEDVPTAVLCQDNMSSIALIERGESNSERTRHINIRYFWIKDLIAREELKLNFQGTKGMIADILTKPLQGKQFYDGRKSLLNM